MVNTVFATYGRSPSNGMRQEQACVIDSEPAHPKPVLRNAFLSVKGAFIGAALISLLINVLMLTGPLFMLQIYDRVLSSGSVPTLLTLSIIVLTLYALYGLLELIRGRIFTRISQKIDNHLTSIAYKTSNNLALNRGETSRDVRPTQDLDNIRTFLGGNGPASLFDLPWMPFYLGIIYLFSSTLGAVALTGALMICVLIGLNEILSRHPSKETSFATQSRLSAIEEGRRNAEAIQAMGLATVFADIWHRKNTRFLNTARRGSDVTFFFGTSIKTLRFILQSAMLAVGAWLVIQQEITAGVMIAASIMTGRAVAPVESAVGNWRSLLSARQSIKTLSEYLMHQDGATEKIKLALPNKSFDVHQLAAGVPDLSKPIIRSVTFSLKAGDGLGVIGPSGSGKSTLARALVGAARQFAGTVRFDGAGLTQWDEDRYGDFIGYLPQSVQLFDGTIAQNISRFKDDAQSESIVEASQMAGIHDFITSLPDGYNTKFISSGSLLSAGQRQRVAIARAVFGCPFLVVLDEPNSNLDAAGDTALTNTIKSLRERGSVVVVVAHRPCAISAVNTVLCLQNGEVTALGPKKETMGQLLSTINKEATG
ncbi:type I secretion system permease/ATPase [Sneathiella marina]|uniref:Type I secretion system permease/ATPase n=1 Tax=Sneathiella marina TaxID=2950108 RepID=A0ABY4W492_9PROT|nr:type I secretion system permease/ATPase [Sneathiella marina]USG62022.1 type I secretion system permease/ATPase [Sneathiella marina]